MTESENKKHNTVKKDSAKDGAPSKDSSVKEYGGRDGLEPTRYGDWEKKGIISDF